MMNDQIHRRWQQSTGWALLSCLTFLWCYFLLFPLDFGEKPALRKLLDEQMIQPIFPLVLGNSHVFGSWNSMVTKNISRSLYDHSSLKDDGSFHHTNGEFGFKLGEQDGNFQQKDQFPYQNTIHERSFSVSLILSLSQIKIPWVEANTESSVSPTINDYTHQLESKGYNIVLVDHDPTQYQGHKHNLILRALEKLDNEQLVILSFAKKILANTFQGLENIVQKFQILTRSIQDAAVISSKGCLCNDAMKLVRPGSIHSNGSTALNTDCAPSYGAADCESNKTDHESEWMEYMRMLAIERGFSDAEYPFLDPAFIMGKATDIRRIFEFFRDSKTNDFQLVLSEILYETPNWIILDYDQTLFGNNLLNDGSEGCLYTWDDDHFAHSLRPNTTPEFIHFSQFFDSCLGNLTKFMASIYSKELTDNKAYAQTQLSLNKSAGSLLSNDFESQLSLFPTVTNRPSPTVVVQDFPSLIPSIHRNFIAPPKYSNPFPSNVTTSLPPLSQQHRDDFLQAKDKKMISYHSMSTYHPKALIIEQFAIIRPFAVADAHQMLESFEVWNEFIPCKQLNYTPQINIYLVFSQNLSAHAIIQSDVEMFLSKIQMEKWYSCFQDVKVVSANIPAEVDTYNPDDSETSDMWVNGPNQQFIFISQAMQRMEWGKYDCWYLMEADSIPIKPFWLDALINEVEAEVPFAVLGSNYRGDLWDSFRNQISPALKFHINGNAIYNSTHSVTQWIVNQMANEKNSTHNRKPYDFRIAELIFDKNISDPDALHLQSLLAFENKTPYVNAMQSISNYAQTPMLEEFFGEEHIVHGVKKYQKLESSEFSIALVVSDFGGDRERSLELMMESLIFHSHPFQEVILVRPNASMLSELFSYNLENKVTGKLIRFHEVSRDAFDVDYNPDYMDWCEAPIASNFFMYTNTFHKLLNPVFIFQSHKTRAPLVPFIQEGSPSCQAFPECVYSVKRARMFASDAAFDLHVQDMEMVFITAVKKEFCDSWKAWYWNTNDLGTCDPLPGPTANDYIAYALSRNHDLQIDLKKKERYGGRSIAVQHTIPPEDQRECSIFSRRLTNTTGCAVETDAASCNALDGCLWRPRFERCISDADGLSNSSTVQPTTPASFDSLETPTSPPGFSGPVTVSLCVSIDSPTTSLDDVKQSFCDVLEEIIGQSTSGNVTAELLLVTVSSSCSRRFLATSFTTPEEETGAAEHVGPFFMPSTLTKESSSIGSSYTMDFSIFGNEILEDVTNVVETSVADGSLVEALEKKGVEVEVEIVAIVYDRSTASPSASFTTTLTTTSPVSVPTQDLGTSLCNVSNIFGKGPFVMISQQIGEVTFGNTCAMEDDSSVVRISFHHISERDVNGGPVGLVGPVSHSFKNISQLRFGTSPFVRTTYQDLCVERIDLRSGLKFGSSSDEVHFGAILYIFCENGTIAIAGNSTYNESMAVTVGTLKFSVFVEDWPFCNGTQAGSSLTYCTDADNQGEYGSYLDVGLSFKTGGMLSHVEQTGPGPPVGGNKNHGTEKWGTGVEYSFSTDSSLVLSQAIKIDGTWMDMGSGYPSYTPFSYENGVSTSLFGLRFPFFSSQAIYDPTISLSSTSSSIDTVPAIPAGTPSPTIAFTESESPGMLQDPLVSKEDITRSGTFSVGGVIGVAVGLFVMVVGSAFYLCLKRGILCFARHRVEAQDAAKEHNTLADVFGPMEEPLKTEVIDQPVLALEREDGQAIEGDEMTKAFCANMSRKASSVSPIAPVGTIGGAQTKPTPKPSKIFSITDGGKVLDANKPEPKSRISPAIEASPPERCSHCKEEMVVERRRCACGHLYPHATRSSSGKQKLSSIYAAILAERAIKKGFNIKNSAQISVPPSNDKVSDIVAKWKAFHKKEIVPHTKVQCEACQKWIEEEEKATHQALSCPYSLWSCYCGYKGKQKDKEFHKIYDCPDPMKGCLNGCGLLGRKGVLQEHEAKECPNRMVSCEHCKKTFQAKNICGHEESCGEKLYTCPQCNEQDIKAEELNHHMKFECCYRTRPCFNFCGVEIKEHEAVDHSKNQCTRRLVLCNICGTYVSFHALESHKKSNCAVFGCTYCGLIMAKQKLDIHQMQECRWKPQKCCWCSELIPLTKLEAHESQCPKQPVECQYCSLLVPSSQLFFHRKEECSCRPISCPNGCPMKVLPEKLQKHLNQLCPLREWICQCSKKVMLFQRRSHLQYCRNFLECWENILQTITKRYDRETLQNKMSKVMKSKKVRPEIILCALAECDGDEDLVLSKLRSRSYFEEMKMVCEIGSVSKYVQAKRMIKATKKRNMMPNSATNRNLMKTRNDLSGSSTTIPTALPQDVNV
mmetsp:Transcript_11550/g.14505  ORF Transcript_11550/g.14505 Transcript_11550/m.14505 type:complete len:2323 (+) Transcript_11550:126-7094(+)